MQSPILIVGQGIAGTLLSFQCVQKKIPFLLVDDGFKSSASMVASGVMNPVTGRQASVTWEVDYFFEKAIATYQKLEAFLGIDIIKTTAIISCPNNAEMRLAYDKQLANSSTFIKEVNEPFPYLNQPFGKVAITPSYLVQVQALLTAWRAFLTKENLLLTTRFKEENLQLSAERINYNGPPFQQVIYANGAAAATSKFWKNLPFALNKGEALIFRIPELAKNSLYKSGIFSVVPWQADEWWVGSSYDNDFTNPFPTEVFAKTKAGQLNHFIHLPKEPIAHLAGVRPSTVDRRPMIGFHPVYTNIGLFNGLGTKGVSMAPAFAESFIDSIVTGKPLAPQNAALERFNKILNR